MGKKIQIQQVRSTVGRIKRQKLTMKALGIRKVGQTVILPDNGAVRGMVETVRHLVVTTQVDGE